MKKDKKSPQQQNKLIRIISLPLRILVKARDLYVKSMNSYADKASSYGGAGGGGFFVTPAPLPRSFSTATARSAGESEDLKDLIRAASARDYGDKIDISSVFPHDRPQTHPSPAAAAAAAAFSPATVAPVMGQSSSVNGRIGGGKVGNFSRLSSSGGGLGLKGVPRSASVGMAKIDEDKPCEADDDDRMLFNGKKGSKENNNNNKKMGKNKSTKKSHFTSVNKGSPLFPRSRTVSTITTRTTTTRAVASVF